MKKIIFALLIAFIGISSALAASVGFFIFIESVIKGGNYMTGVYMFFLGIISFFVLVSTYMISTALKQLELIIPLLSELTDLTLNKKPTGLFDGLNMTGTTIKMSEIDEHGNITPISDKTMGIDSTPLINIISQMWGKPRENKLEDMTIEELNQEREKAVRDSNFERAAQIRDIIENKNNL